MLTAADLIAFEDEVAARFARAEIPYPVHLSGGNEKDLIEIFAHIRPNDWVLCGWRSHYHCLLHGVPPDELMVAIMEGRSVALCFPRYKILSSGIVGGIAPIAVGLAWSVKQRNANDPTGNTDDRVWCFLGDMSAESGAVHEAMKYAARHDLPVEWVTEDNGVSVKTDTFEAWGTRTDAVPHARRYSYVLTRPHVGIDQWVKFK